MASYDYLIPLNDSNRFYVGAHAGFVSLKGKIIKRFRWSGDINVGFLHMETQLWIYLWYYKNVEFEEIGLNYTNIMLISHIHIQNFGLMLAKMWN